MSLASLLTGKKRAIDTELDSIFHSQTAEHHPDSPPNDHLAVEKKKKHRSSVHVKEPDRKRSKPLSSRTTLPSNPSPRKEKKGRKKHVKIVPEPESEHGSSDVDKSENLNDASMYTSAPESQDEDASPVLIHETLQKDRPNGAASKREKYAPPGETRERRDARTIFIGNLVPEVAVKRPLQKQLHRHVLALVPTAKIESTRFRSVAFNTPTSKLPEETSDATKHKQTRKHERDRAASWRDTNPVGEPKTDVKTFLTPSQKKRIAFIHKDVHSDADSVHAYIVFAYPPPHSRPTNLPPLPPVMDPFEAARRAIEKCNGTMFLDRMLRVDTVVKQSPVGGPSNGALSSSIIGDPKISIFVGNLDFTSKEEDLRVFFEEIMRAERGLPDVEGMSDGAKLGYWVTRVRMIRDKDTQLGKGFAYVQFADRTCVDEILALEPEKLKFAKRKLRVQRCKSVSNASSGKRLSPSKPVRTSNPTVPSVPKGDPSFGEKLAKLTKEERKRVKAADADRVARRVAKKKARIALAKQGVPVQSKQRERVRKTSAAKKAGGVPPQKLASKGRIRSEKSIAKRNTKK